MLFLWATPASLWTLLYSISYCMIMTPCDTVPYGYIDKGAICCILDIMYTLKQYLLENSYVKYILRKECA